MSRPRASHACRECRRRKVKCDLSKPTCKRCAAVPGCSCVYDGGSTSTQEFRFIPTTFQDGRTRPVTDRGQTSSAQVVISASRLQAIEGKLESLTAMVHHLQERPSIESEPKSEEDSVSPQDTISDSAKRSRTAHNAATESLEHMNVGHLDVQPGGRLRYVSQRHWASLCEELGEIETLLRGQTRYEAQDSQLPTIYSAGIFSPPPSWDLAPGLSPTFRQVSPLHTLQIPDRSRCDALFELYVSSIHPIVPLVHMPTFRQEYETFWDMQHSGQTKDAIPTSPLILAALYAGAAVGQQPPLRQTLPDLDMQEIATELYNQATSSLHAVNFPRAPSVSTLAAYLIVQGIWMRDEEPLNTGSFNGVIVRVAQMLGLHRDPSHFKAAVAPIPAEVHRRVWWHVFHCDVLVAVASGLPPLIERDSWDTRMVSDLCEEKWGTVEGLHYEEEVRQELRRPSSPQDPSSLTSPLGIWLQGKFQESLAVRELLNKTFNEKSMTIDDMKSARDDLEKLGRKLKDLAQRIPIEAMSTTYRNDIQFNMWAKILLSLMSDKNWWFLHSPLLHRSINQAWQAMTPNLQLHCCAFLEQFVIISCAEDFVRFHWSWPGNHQPLHALMLVLKEVERNPTSAEAAVSCMIVDQIMALCAPDGGITSSAGWNNMMHRPLTEGGAEAWDFIWRLRARVWTKVGLDPNVILTREEVCVVVAQKMAAFKKAGGKLDLQTPVQQQLLSHDDENDGSGEQPSAQAQFGVPAQPDAPSLVHSGLGQGVEEDPFDHRLTFSLGGTGPTPNINWEEWDSIFNSVPL